METTSTKAMLIGADDFDAASGAVSTIISREEIEQALRSDEPAVLMLDVVRAAAAGSPRKRETLSVQWDRWDLERLLKVGSGVAARRRRIQTAVRQPLGDCLLIVVHNRIEIGISVLEPRPREVPVQVWMREVAGVLAIPALSARPFFPGAEKALREPEG